MSYRTEPILVAVNRMNNQYFLPAIQREYVWKTHQIVALFDSILRGYPISSFLFWELQPENRDRWQVYKFIENASDGGTHNTLANLNGVNAIHLVLDGQQRLTSLLIGLKGTYSVRKKHGRWDNPDAWSRQRLHIDLLAEPKINDDDRDSGIYYKFAFKESTPAPDKENFWFEVGKIMDFNEKARFDDYVDETLEMLDGLGLPRSDKRLFERNIERLYNAIHVDDVIAYYTETDQDYDRVLDIFVRANEGGTKLSKSDLLLSMITSKWDGINARDEIFAFVDRINNNLTRRNDFDKDFIMKASLVLTDLPVVYKVENFSNQNLELIRSNWPSIKIAVERGVDLINSFGIDRDNLTSVNAIIPIIYYLYRNPHTTLRGTTEFEVKNAQRIRQWLILALVKGAFGRASDGLLTGIRGKLKEPVAAGFDFPVEQINATIASTGLSMKFDDESIVEDILSSTYRGKQTFLILSLLYDDANWGTINFDQDHIFASNLFKPKELSAQGNKEWFTQKDRLGNLCLLMTRENMGKQDMPPFEWLSSRGVSFIDRHLIPQDRSLWRFDRFPDFLAAREKLIVARLKELVGPQA